MHGQNAFREPRGHFSDVALYFQHLDAKFQQEYQSLFLRKKLREEQQEQ